MGKTCNGDWTVNFRTVMREGQAASLAGLPVDEIRIGVVPSSSSHSDKPSLKNNTWDASGRRARRDMDMCPEIWDIPRTSMYGCLGQMRQDKNN